MLTLPAPGQETKATTQDPDRPAPTPAEELAQLQRERDRLRREIDYVQQRVQNAKGLLAGKFARRTLSVREVDAGRASGGGAPAMPPVAPRYARLMTEEEIAALPEGTVLVVGGTPIQRQEIDQLIAYQSDTIDHDLRAQMAVYDLIRIEGVAAEFSDGDLETVVQDAAAQLAEGRSVAELAGVYGTLPGAAEDGAVEITRNGRFGLRLEQLAFSMAPGTTSRPFRHHGGMVVLHVDRIEKGASPELDRVLAHALQVPYSPEPERVQKAQHAVVTAQVDIAVHDKTAMALLPGAFRDPGDQVRRAASADLEVLQKTIEELRGEIERARASGTEIDQGRVPALEQRLKRALDKLEQSKQAAGSDQDDGAAQAEVQGKKEAGRKNPN
ncbi:MAG: peptidyl-prolyl cis-trans isomerase [Planctomycetes bacterium]|nr:peptidyl-prolyl cis-trans isomerase [Planctomycetota bacterium]